jgi:PAS domain S-box-containing protein
MPASKEHGPLVTRQFHLPLLLPAALGSQPGLLAAAESVPPAAGARMAWIAATIALGALLLALPFGLRLLRNWRQLQERDATFDAELVATASALRESQARYREVVESVKEVIFRTDSSGRLTFLNHAWETVTGYPVEESLGKELVSYLHPDDRAAAREQMVEVASGLRSECHCELRLRTRQGEVRWIEATGRAISTGADSRPALTGTLDDISGRKVAELTLKNINQELEARVKARTAELEASNRELEAFSYSVSHDLRAPLRAIDGFAQILEEELAERAEPSVHAHLGRIRKGTQRMSQLIDDLIGLARLTRQPLNRETVDLSEMAAQIIDELRAEEPQRKVEVAITQRLIVNADRNLMRVVLENLLRNAWKFTAGRDPARINFQIGHARGLRVFCISDNGAGFDMAFASNLFRPFHRLHGSGEYEGTGIGLATVQRIIQRHGGVVWAQARPNEGARFFFTVHN